METANFSVEIHKYGGTAMDPENGGIGIIRIAEELAEITRDGHTRVIAVVSAGGKDTDRLIVDAQRLAPNLKLGDPAVDHLVASGERESVGRLWTTLAGSRIGVRNAMGLSAHQLAIGIDPNATSATLVRSVDGSNLLRLLSTHPIIVVPGFVGIDNEGIEHTIGRGGSDTTAVALAAGLQNVDAGKVPVFVEKEPAGVAMCPPHLVEDPAFISHLTHEQCLELLRYSQNEFIAERAIRLAMKAGIDMVFRKAPCFVSQGSGRDFGGTVISANRTGSLEEANDLRALTARTFLRLDVTPEDYDQTLDAFVEHHVAHEDVKEAHRGHKIFMPTLDGTINETARQTRDDVLINIGAASTQRVCLLRFTAADMRAETQYTGEIRRLLRDLNSACLPTTEARAVLIEVAESDAKEVATAISKKFGLVKAA